MYVCVCVCVCVCVFGKRDYALGSNAPLCVHARTRVPVLVLVLVAFGRRCFSACQRVRVRRRVCMHLGVWQRGAGGLQHDIEERDGDDEGVKPVGALNDKLAKMMLAVREQIEAKLDGEQDRRRKVYLRKHRLLRRSRLRQHFRLYQLAREAGGMEMCACVCVQHTCACSAAHKHTHKFGSLSLFSALHVQHIMHAHSCHLKTTSSPAIN